MPATEHCAHCGETLAMVTEPEELCSFRLWKWDIHVWRWVERPFCYWCEGGDPNFDAALKSAGDDGFQAGYEAGLEAKP